MTSVLPIPKLVLWLLLVTCTMKCMILVTGGEQIKSGDYTRFPHVFAKSSRPTVSTSQSVKRRHAGSGPLGTVQIFQQEQWSRKTVSPISHEKDSTTRSGTSKIVKPFQQEQPVENRNGGGILQILPTFHKNQPVTKESTMSWQTGHGTKDRGESPSVKEDMDHEDLTTSLDAENIKPNIPDSSGKLYSGFDYNVAKNTLRPDGDTFPCHPCVCSYLQKNVLANCTRKTTYGVPANLPIETWAMFLLWNNIASLDLADLQHYTSLSILSISWNVHLRTIKNSQQESVRLPLQELRLDHGNITTIEDKSFTLTPNLLKLNLEHNNLHNITNFMFEGLDALVYLNLSRNQIIHIEFGAFDHLISLKELDLSRNEVLGYYSTRFSPRLFENLHKLILLNIAGSSHGAPEYPNKVLEKLPNLQTLSIDGHYKATFEPEIKMLKNFTTLRIGDTGNCYLTCVSSTFFENIPRIRHLSLRKCHTLRLKSEIVPMAEHIATLEISHATGYDLFTALEDMVVFQNSSLTSLTLVTLRPHSREALCRYLRQTHAKNLQHLNLEELDLSGNMLVLVGYDFLNLLPKTLTRLVLRDNKLILISLEKLGFMTQLIDIDMSFQNTQYQPPNYLKEERFCPTKHECEMQSQEIHCKSADNIPRSTSSDHTGDSTTKLINTDFRRSYCNDDFVNHTEAGQEIPRNCSLPCADSVSVSSMPPNLKIIRASHFIYYGYLILYIYRGVRTIVNELDLSHNFLVRGKRFKIPNHVKIADLRNNYCRDLSLSFFRRNNSVIYLFLQDNFLGSTFAEDYQGKFFAELSQAQHVDISNNVIFSLPFRFFLGLRSTQTLKLDNNKLQALNVSLASMKELRHLNLSHNSISWVSKDTMKDLDIIASQHLLTVDLTSNPLPCTCAGLELLYWMSKTNVYFMHQKYLQCRLTNNVLDHIGDFDERVKYLQKHCASKAVIIVICVACFALVAILVGFSLMYRFRWRLRYLRNIAMAKLVGFMPEEEENHNYKFDAYVLFSEDAQAFVIRQCLQELEVKRGHKLCISVRNFMPGAYMVSNIVGAVQHSAKTVVVVTPDLYKKDYAEYTIKMALMEEIYNKRSVLHLCVYQPMPDEEMAQCHDLLMVMKRDDYTEYPPENEVREEIMENFWDRLSQAIGHANHDDVDADDDD